MENIMQVIIIWFMAGVFINLFVFAVRGIDAIWETPKDVYDQTEMNWFGAVITYFVMFALDPLWYIAKLIWWVFHVGK